MRRLRDKLAPRPFTGQRELLLQVMQLNHEAGLVGGMSDGESELVVPGRVADVGQAEVEHLFRLRVVHDYLPAIGDAHTYFHRQVSPDHE